MDLSDREDTGVSGVENVTLMMVGEVASPGYVPLELSCCSLPAVDMVIAEPVADFLIVGQAVPVVDESPDIRNTFDSDILNIFETAEGMPVYYGGDLNDSDCVSVGDHDLDTWENWCDSDLRTRYYGFCPDTADAQPSIIFGLRVFRGEDRGQPS